MIGFKLGYFLGALAAGVMAGFRAGVTGQPAQSAPSPPVPTQSFSCRIHGTEEWQEVEGPSPDRAAERLVGRWIDPVKIAAELDKGTPVHRVVEVLAPPPLPQRQFITVRCTLGERDGARMIVSEAVSTA